MNAWPFKGRMESSPLPCSFAQLLSLVGVLGFKVFRCTDEPIVDTAKVMESSKQPPRTALSAQRLTHLISMGLECLPSLEQCLQARKNTRPSIGAGNISWVILGPLVMRHRYFGGFCLRGKFDRGA